MYRVYLVKDVLVVFDKTEKDLRIKYGSTYEQVGVIKDISNVDAVCDKLVKQYRAKELIKDYYVKRKIGWKYWSEEMRASIRAKMSAIKTGRKYSAYHKKRISEAMKEKGIANHTGKKHNSDTKMIMSLKTVGHKRNLGLRWIHDPGTGQEKKIKRGDPLPEGFLFGRNPELRHELGFMANIRKR